MQNIPNATDMEVHLRCLHDWHAFPFEIRCLHSHKPVAGGQFEAIDPAIKFATAHNQQGYNVYTIPNPLKARTANHAADADILAAKFHWADVDKLDDADRVIDLLDTLAAEPAFMVQTGAHPSLRFHIYWQRADFTADLAQWSDMQARIAHCLGSDGAVKNPSRLMRLAGTWTYPARQKIARGYRSERTQFVSLKHKPVAEDVFVAAFPALPTPSIRLVASQAPVSGDVPLAAIQAALDAIPVVMLHGDVERRRWLDVLGCCKACGPHARTLFEQWQRRSPIYQPEDDDVWDSLHVIGTRSVSGLFRMARNANADFWRGDEEVEDWWRSRAEDIRRSATTAEERIKARMIWELRHQKKDEFSGR